MMIKMFIIIIFYEFEVYSFNKFSWMKFSSKLGNKVRRNLEEIKLIR